MKTSITIICEGASELAYIQEINRYMRENEIDYVFHARDAQGGFFANIERKYSHEYQKNSKQWVEIWVDGDIYIRDEIDLQERYDNRIEHMPDFRFNYMNFEDFLIMHLEDDKLKKWEALCRKQGHFITPMIADAYKPLLREHIFRDYRKGFLPDQFAITQDCLARLFQHNKDDKIPFRSDFADFLEDILVASK
ncbi:MAG: hypothetical protein LBV04_04350 [Deferribacteraceae bacterium]|jgi:phage pi2 protein 07|nr:hypothetical protein [Deferribacteraceae bacterium]